MIFRAELAAKVLAGEKTVTRRLTSTNPRSPWWVGKCRYYVGQQAAVQPGRGRAAIGAVKIRSVELQGWTGSVPLAEARAEGCDSVEEFLEVFERLNGNVPVGRWLWRVEFRPVPAALLAAG